MWNCQFAEIGSPYESQNAYQPFSQIYTHCTNAVLRCSRQDIVLSIRLPGCQTNTLRIELYHTNLVMSPKASTRVLKASIADKKKKTRSIGLLVQDLQPVFTFKLRQLVWGCSSLQIQTGTIPICWCLCLCSVHQKNRTRMEKKTLTAPRRRHIWWHFR